MTDEELIEQLTNTIKKQAEIIKEQQLVIKQYDIEIKSSEILEISKKENRETETSNL